MKQTKKGKGRYGWTSFILTVIESEKINPYNNNYIFPDFEIERGNLKIHGDGQVYFNSCYPLQFAVRNDNFDKLKKIFQKRG